MSNIYDMSGKKKVVFTEEIKNLTYKEIMTFIIKNATTEEVIEHLYKKVEEENE